MMLPLEMIVLAHALGSRLRSSLSGLPVWWKVKKTGGKKGGGQFDQDRRFGASFRSNKAHLNQHLQQVRLIGGGTNSARATVASAWTRDLLYDPCRLARQVKQFHG
jgi:hypothetical protein